MKALKRNPYHPNWIRALADVLYKKGDYENALYMYNQWLFAIPEFWKWKDELSQHTKEEQKSYRIFIKNTPYFWEVIARINEIVEKLNQE